MHSWISRGRPEVEQHRASAVPSPRVWLRGRAARLCTRASGPSNVRGRTLDGTIEADGLVVPLSVSLDRLSGPALRCPESLRTAYPELCCGHHDFDCFVATPTALWLAEEEARFERGTSPRP